MAPAVTTQQFDSRQFPLALRLQRFEEYVQGHPMHLMSAAMFRELNGDNPNVFRQERLYGKGVCLSILNSSGFVSTAGERKRDARLGTVTVGLLKSGSAEVRTGQDHFKLKDGDIYINATSNFETTFGESAVTRLIFPAGPIKELFHRSGEFVVFRKNRPVTEILSATISGFEKALRESEMAEVNQMSRLAIDLTSRIIEEQVLWSARSGYEIIRERAREYIHDNFASPSLQIGDIAAYVGTSRSTLYRSFEGIGGVREYIMSVRLEAAKLLIGRGTPERSALSNIALACGFDTAGRLRVAFKSRFGVSPTLYENVDGQH